MKVGVEGKQKMVMDIGPLEKVRYQDDQLCRAVAMVYGLTILPHP